MNLIEALKQANGNPVARKYWKNNASSCGIVFSDTGNKELVYADRVLPWEPTKEQILADDWYVVEPKSAIEQGIEREAKKFWGELPVGKNTMAELVSMGSRIVNLTLDEAKKAFNPHDCTVVALSNTEISNRIDALKVKD